MSFIGMMEAKLPPGFRFHPRDDELICDYLQPKASGNNDRSFHGCLIIVDVDLNKVEPWQLPAMACVGDKEWYFFSLRDRKYATGQRTNRATASGYWKATGKDRSVSRKGALVGMRKTLVFYQGRAPKGKKTEWVMHEFRVEGNIHPSLPKFSLKEDWVLCRVFYKSRSTSAKASTDTSCDDTSSSSLPQLMDTYIPFEQAPPRIEGLGQVPCFSNYNTIATQHPMGRGLAHLGAGLSEINPYMKVLHTITKMEASHGGDDGPNLTEGSSESYLTTDPGLPSIWNPF